MGGNSSLGHLLGRLSVAEARTRHLVARRRAGDPEPDDPVRGLYISEEEVDRLLDPAATVEPADVAALLEQVETRADAAVDAGDDVRLRRLATTFALDDLDVEILLVALAPDLDRRFERLFGYLHDDVTRRRASVGLAFDLLGIAPADGAARSRVLPGSALVLAGLLVVEEPERPLLTRPLRVPDRVAAHLLGDDAPPPQVASAITAIPATAVEGAEEVRGAVLAGEYLVHVRQSPRSAGLAVAVAGLTLAGWDAIAIDLGSVPRDNVRDVVREAVLEAGLRDGGLVLGAVDDAAAHDPAVLSSLVYTPVPTVVVSAGAWEPTWSADLPVSITAGAVDPARRQALWHEVAGDVGFDPAAATAAFRLRPEQVLQSWRTASRLAAAAGRPVTADDLRTGARLQNAGRLDRLARHVEARADFGDLVLPPRVLAMLREIVERARHRDEVLDSWHMGGRSDKGRGITALFAGPSGTGKTLSAEVVAGALALDLYVIDLSTVVDKYIGETEKNLERVFDRAEDLNAILFFDEADAIFGKRSEVSDARDRYANLEIAFLLQRMERFDGITILATNLRANLDDAFTRRIDVLVEFPEPPQEDRRRLWDLHLPEQLPREDELDLEYLAKAFELAGGDIRNVTLAAAYAAAAANRRVTTADLVRATAREYRKLGRLVTESEFGPYYDLVSTATRPDERERHVR